MTTPGKHHHWVATFTDDRDDQVTYSISVRFDDEPETRELDTLCTLYNATSVAITKVNP